MATCVSVDVKAGVISSCINVTDVNVDCKGYTSQGMMRYEVSFSFNTVKAGTNFIRIRRGNNIGKVFTYPFKLANQIDTVTDVPWCHWETFYIDVYDVLPNGKVVKCTITYPVWLCCDGEEPGNDKEVVAGETSESVVSNLVLAPNPAMDAVQVTLTVPSFDPSSSVDIVDMSGSVVATVAQGMAAGTTVIETSLFNLTTGSYMVRMLHPEGAVVMPLRVVR